MADLYGQVLRGDGVSTYTVGANTRKTLTDESRFGTPDLTLLVIDIDNDETSSVYFTDGEGDEDTALESDSTLFKALQALQTRVELYKVGQVDNTEVSVFVRSSSVPLSAGEELEDGDTNAILSALLSAALGVSVEVWHAELDGDDIDYD
jgi:hypothetical protein